MKPPLPAPRKPLPPRHAKAPISDGGATTRAVIGVVGELLITAGVFLMLFTGWQLVWTDVVGERAQAQIVEELPWVAPQRTPAAEPSKGADPLPVAQPGEGEPPLMDYPEHLESFAVLRIPIFGDDYVKPISEGVERKEVLDALGIGHYPDAALPGQVGNFAMAGHRTTYGKPFNRIAELQRGDAIIVESPVAWYVYRVTEHLIVKPTAVEVVAPVPGQPGVEPTGRFLTMTACHPMYSARERYIIHAELDAWYPHDNGLLPPELDPGYVPAEV